VLQVGEEKKIKRKEEGTVTPSVKWSDKSKCLGVKQSRAFAFFKTNKKE
jgi:hypothetical protein